MSAQDDEALVATGIDGLDDILQGGLLGPGLYLVEGDPGAGKTTLALQFLRAGVSAGERCLYVTLSESEAELRSSARSHDWDLQGIDILELSAAIESLRDESQYRMYHPSEVELGETTRLVLDAAKKLKPHRLVFDSLSELRLLADSPLLYRRQILALKQYFSRNHCTVLLVDDRTSGKRDMHLHSLAQGAICLERETPEYGAMRRRVHISKMRGRAFREGYHDYVIRRGGLQVFPRLIAAEHENRFVQESRSTGVAAMDQLLGGGLSRGTSTLLLGAAGTGKTSLATRIACTAAENGERAVIYLFDESPDTFRIRSVGLGMNIPPLVEKGDLSLRHVDPAGLSPGEFASSVRREVDQGCRLIVIDGLNGYLNAMPSERFLTLHLRELLSYLGNKGVITILLLTHHGLLGQGTVPFDASYIADTVILLRFFEAAGEVRQAISVIKKRTGTHERTIRELRLDRGIVIGEPIREFQNVLAGTSTSANILDAIGPAGR